ncbi:MAG: FAD-dependent oxidoreductase, partial [Nitrosomonadales bacterium]|nr:FAD-dependent oxidoreductase [Nitrosomonadales bacterium]
MALRAVVIGGGIVGCITAIKLKESGYDVTVVDKS